MKQNYNPTMSLIFLLLTTVPIMISFSSAATMNNDTLIIATQEMQKANYFTFVMLLNMAPPNSFQGNVTFLMPNDRILANATAITGATVLDFLLRHSIPSPLLIDHLEHFPTGTMIPASKPGFVFEVTNEGRRRLSLANVRIISPNICTRGDSIRCHGVDGVAQPVMLPQPNLPPRPTCSSSAPVMPAPAPPPGLRPRVDSTPAVMAASPPTMAPPVPRVSNRNSSSGCRSTSTVVFNLLTISALVIVGYVN